jgi:4'-phosphopantetheinyl transferase
MPLVFEKQINPAKKLAVWQITEPLSFFLSDVLPDRHFIGSAKRQMERAACYHLLDYMAGSALHEGLERDLFGKPYIKNSDISISFSHSGNMVACIIDLNGLPVGIDIEEKRERILRISHKFIGHYDVTPSMDVFYCHLIWGAKEVLYKIYAQKELDFIHNMHINLKNQFAGTIIKQEYSAIYQLEYAEIDNFILVWNI